MLSVKSSGAVCEVNTEVNLPFRISDQYATIGDETRPWHIHVNLRETKEARFLIENKTNGRNNYSIRFFDSTGNFGTEQIFSGCMMVQTHLSKKDS